MLHRRSKKSLIAQPWVFPDFAIVTPDIETDIAKLDDIPDYSHPVTDGPFSLLKFPDLEFFQYGPIDQIPSNAESTRSDVEDERDNADEEIDVWAAVSFERYDISNKIKSWDHFRNRDYEEPLLYLSEAQEDVWNAIWQKRNTSKSTELVNRSVEQAHVLRPLIDLGLGCSSAMFTFRHDGKVSRNCDLLFSGLSEELTSSIVDTISTCGRNLRFVEEVVNPRSLDRNSRAWIALCSAIHRITHSIRNYTSETSFQVGSILQVQALFRKPALILMRLRVILENCKDMKTDLELIDFLVQAIEIDESAETWYRPILLQLLATVAGPLLEDLSKLTGVCHENNEVIKDAQVEQFLSGTVSETDRLSMLFDVSQENLMCNTYQGLKLLRTHQLENELNRTTSSRKMNKVKLELGIDVSDIERIQQKAIAYERELHLAIDSSKSSQYQEPISETHEYKIFDNFNPFGIDLDLLEDNITDSIATLNEIQFQAPDNNRLSLAVKDVLVSKDDSEIGNPLQPPFAILRLESFTPLLMAQSRAVDRVCLQMIVKDHDLIHNLEVLYDFHLLGFGMFTLRLKQALFSSDMASAERKKGYHRAGALGLRLEARTKWPPASAELRLSLMGILSDSYSLAFPGKSHEGLEQIPGGLAFSIRHLSEPEIEACMDPMSLAALDFLRLQYRPPKALGAVITEAALEKYDRIFRFLLRLSRVAYAVDTTWSSGRNHDTKIDPAQTRFKFEIRHFVQTLVTYVHNRIAISWQQLHRILTQIESQINNNHDDHNILGLSQLRNLHDLMLDKIMFDLLLRKRHQKAMQVLESALALVLQHATATEEQLPAIMQQFSIQARLFVSICRNHSEQTEHTSAEDARLSSDLKALWSSKSNSADGLQSLLLALDMNGWYAKD